MKPEDLEPDITGFEFYYDAFKELSTTRQSGFGVGPIPFTALIDYFTIYNIEGDFDEFASIIRHMDNVFLELNAKEMNAEKKGNNNSGNANNHKNNSN